MPEVGRCDPLVGLKILTDTSTPRVVMRSLPFYCEGVLPLHVSATQENAVMCLVKRLAREVKVDRSELALFRNFVRIWIRQNLTPISAVYQDQQCRFDEWIEKTHYSRLKKDRVRREFAIFQKTGDSRGFKYLGSFLKVEFYEAVKVARGINPRSNACNGMFGPLVKKIEHEVYSLPEFVKNVPVVDRPDKIFNSWAKGMPCCTTDYTAFEGSFTPQFMHACECQLYQYMLPQYGDEVRFMCKILTGENRLRSKWFSADLQGKRMSGDMCTSLGNGFSNLMLMKYAAFRKNNGNGWKELVGFVEGDDGLFFVDPTTDLNLEAIRLLGFTLKMVVDDEPGVAGFCGLLYDMKSRVVVANPRRHLASIGWATGRYIRDTRFDVELLRAKGFSLAFSYAGGPIMSSLARYLLRVTAGHVARYDLENWWSVQILTVNSDCGEMSPRCRSLLERSVSPSARALMSERYGIPEFLQLELEQYFDNCKVLAPLPLQFSRDLFPAWDPRRLLRHLAVFM